MKRRGVYPFTAIVGQEDMKLSLILNVINPALGGVLIKGEKGTAKSTAVRALAELLPAMETVKGCRFHCDPLQENFLCDDCTAKFHSGELKETETLKMRVVELPVSARWMWNMRSSTGKRSLNRACWPRPTGTFYM